MNTDANQPEQVLLFDDQTGRWSLGDEPLHAGDCFELALENGSWVPVRFEWQHHSAGRPTGYLILGLTDGFNAHIKPVHGARARLRSRSEPDESFQTHQSTNPHRLVGRTITAVRQRRANEVVRKPSLDAHAIVLELDDGTVVAPRRAYDPQEPLLLIHVDAARSEWSILQKGAA